MKVEQLETGKTAVRKLMFSFERFYKSMIRLNDDFDKLFRRFNGMKFENADEDEVNIDDGCPDLSIERHVDKLPSNSVTYYLSNNLNIFLRVQKILQIVFLFEKKIFMSNFF